jgi:hypothetical protein
VIKSTQDTEIRHYDATSATIETNVKVEAAGKVSITEGLGQNATLRLENQGGKYGEIIASETGGFMAVQANSGYNLLMESTTGNVNISAANADTTLTAQVNGATAGLTLTDVGGNGNISMSANQMDAVVSGGTIALDSDVAVAIKNSAGNPTLRFENPSATGYPNANMTYLPTGNYAGTSESLMGDFPEMGLTTGIVEAIRIGCYPEPYVYGGGLPLTIKHNPTDPEGVRLENGQAFMGIQNGINPDTGLLVQQNSGNPIAKLIIDAATASAGLEYDSSIPQVKFNFNSADFISGSAGAATGQYLRIFINGNEYKIALLNP